MRTIERQKRDETDVAPPAHPAREAEQAARQRAVGVFLFAAAFFLLLMSGHIYARDEETLYQMTDGLARHGIPLVSPEVWGIVDSAAPSKGGLRPTSYAPGQPLLAVPFYWLGQAAAALAGPEYRAYLERFPVLAFNSFITAAIVALLFRFALALGYRVRVGVALAICYGAATYAAIEARTFFAEPLTSFLVLLAFLLLRLATAEARSFSYPPNPLPSERRGGEKRFDTMLPDRRHALSLAASGFVAAAALFVKVHAAIFLPVLALYLVMTTLPWARSFRWSAWRPLVARGVLWIAGMAPPLLALALYNRWLYGGPLTTGYGGSAIFATPLSVGLHGLLYSTGKGIIWYAPPLIFAMIGLPSFIRRFPHEGVAVLIAAAANILFYAKSRYWHEDGFWGPRYLLIVLPWLLLPALPVLDRLLAPGWSRLKGLARAGAVAIVLAGIFVQSLAFAVSFDIPLLTTSEPTRYFTPSQSPLVVSFRTARSRLSGWWGDHHPPANSFLIGSGLYPVEVGGVAPFSRWTNGDAVVTLHARDGVALHVKLTYFDHRPPTMRATATPVTVTLGATPLPPVDRLSIAPANEGFILAYDISPALLRSAGDRLSIAAPTWNPARAGTSGRDEDLGIFVNNLEIWADGVPMTARAVTLLPPSPTTPRQVWVWANYPDQPHLLDWWPIMLHDARVPPGSAAVIVVGMLGSVVLLLIGGFRLRSVRTHT